MLRPLAYKLANNSDDRVGRCRCVYTAILSQDRLEHGSAQ